MTQQTPWLCLGDVAVCGVSLFQLLWVHKDGRLARIRVEPSGAADRTLILVRTDLKDFLHPAREMTATERREVEDTLRNTMATVNWGLSVYD